MPVRLYTFNRGKRREWAFRIGEAEGLGALPDEAIRHALEGLSLDDLAQLRKHAETGCPVLTCTDGTLANGRPCLKCGRDA